MIRRLARALLLALLVCRPAVARAQPAVEYYHLDALGSVRAVTSEAGTVVRRHDYFPFGEEYLAQPGTDPVRFAGKERDAETNLDYVGARYYANRTGRFTTVDPGHVGGDPLDPQSWNAYAYARNNPLRFIDPTGTEYLINWLNDGQWSRSIASDAAWEDSLSNPGSGFHIQGNNILAIVNGRWVIAGYFSYLGPDQPRTFNAFVQQTGQLADRWLKETLTDMAIGTAMAATGGLAAGALSGGLAAEGLTVTGRLAPLEYGKKAGKLARQMAARGWTDDMIREAIASGKQVRTVNFANGNPAIRYIHPTTGQSVIVDTVTKKIIMVGGRGFSY